METFGNVVQVKKLKMFIVSKMSTGSSEEKQEDLGATEDFNVCFLSKEMATCFGNRAAIWETISSISISINILSLVFNCNG